MPFNDNDRLLWTKYETLSIIEGAYLIYGIEPKSFLYEDARGGNQQHFECATGEDVHDISEQIESVALGGNIEFAHKVLLPDGSPNREKTLLKKHSFANWCRSHHPEIATLLSPVTEPDEIATSSAEAQGQPATEQELAQFKVQLKEISSCINSTLSDSTTS